MKSFQAQLNVLIAYEDFATGKLSMRLCERLIGRLGHEFQFHTCFWKFDVLRMPKLKAIAAQDAFEADILIIAAHGGGELPTEVRKWMTGWRPKPPQRRQALVELLAGAPSPTNSFLRQFARYGQLAFFSHSVPSSLNDLENYFGPKVAAAMVACSGEQLLRRHRVE